MHRAACLTASFAVACIGDPAATAGDLGTACGADSQCVPGALCMGGVCVQLCSRDVECPKSYACRDGTCAIVDYDCTSDLQCATPGVCQIVAGAYCEGGRCHYAPKEEHTPCDDANRCTIGDACDNAGACVGAPGCLPPVGIDPGAVATDEDGSSAPTVLSGTDVDEEVHALSVTVTVSPAHGTVAPSSGGAPLAVVYTPAPDFFGSDGFAFTLTDSDGEVAAPVSVSVTVRPLPDAPVAEDLQAVFSGSLHTGSLPAFDADGDAILYIVETEPAFGNVTVDADTGVFVYEPSGSFACDDAFTFKVTDGQVLSNVASVTLARPAELTGVAPEHGTTGVPLTLTGTCLGDSTGVVRIGGRSAPVVSWSSALVAVTVPPDYLSGAHAVVVSTPYGVDSNPQPYTIEPWITDLSPRVANSGAVLSVTGDAFGLGTGAAYVGALPAAVEHWTNTLVELEIPAAASGGQHYVHLETAAAEITNSLQLTVRGNDVWVRDEVPASRPDAVAVWTGSELLVWGGGDSSGASDSGARYRPATDTWLAMSRSNAPSPRYGHTAVWTGSELIVWGGATSAGTVNTGGRYDPATDTWTATSVTAKTPVARRYHTAVWTGSEMIVWGGFTSVETNTGGRYDPSTDSWEATSTTAGAPAARYFHTAVWTGSEMVIWGGYPATNSGGHYQPGNNTWAPTSVVTETPAARYAHTAVWTGSEMIVWGGNNRDTGGRYDPTTKTWAATSLTDAPGGRSGHTAVWTGAEMIVWGGDYDVTGGRYRPATDTWLATAEVPSRRERHTAVWTGSEMIIWGGDPAPLPGERYRPANNTWVSMRRAAPVAPWFATAVWTGSEVICWGPGAGGRYTPATDTWAAVSTAGAPTPLRDHGAVWTGTEMLLWGSVFDPVPFAYVNAGGLYDPIWDRWRAASTANAPAPRSSNTAVWTGSQMIVWGGNEPVSPYTPLASGGRYNPTTNTWTPTIVTAETPAARYSHTAVWTGSEMIIWGGATSSGVVNTGGRYDPAGNSWVATSLSSAPTARMLHTAVWDGDEMIVWGGSGASGATDTGGRYHPASDTWAATSLTDAPSARLYYTAVWTGSAMIVWSGMNGTFVYTDTGGRYDPVGDTWLPTSTASAPQARSGHVAVWTGVEMIVLGGSPSIQPGRYTP